MTLRNALTGFCLLLLSLPLHLSAVAGTVEGPDALCIGEEVTYTRSGLPDPMSGYPYIWSSSDPAKVAVIDADAGKFKGVALSTIKKDDVTITVADTRGNSASKSVTVVQLKRIVITAGGSGNSDDNNSDANAAPICADNPVTLRAVTENFDDVGGSGIEWSVRTSGGVWQSQGTGKESTLTLSPPDNYEVKAECGSKSVSIFVVSLSLKVNITQAPAWVLLSSPSSDSSSYTATADGTPSGGGYQWTWATKSGGNGEIAVISGDTTDTVILRGEKASKATFMNDVELTVAYTMGAVTCHDHATISMRRPTSTTITDGGEYNSPSGAYEHYYYHKVNDQAGAVIDLVGMQASESLTHVSGSTTAPLTGVGQTLFYSGYGISIKDTLGATVYTDDAEWKQDITVEGWWVSPAYRLSYGPLDASKSQW